MAESTHGYSTEERERAAVDVVVKFGNEQGPQWARYAVELQCELNRAVELLRELEHSREFLLYIDPQSSYGESVRDFLSRYPHPKTGATVAPNHLGATEQ